MPLSTDLTIYEASELLDGNGTGTGSYKLTRRSLEPGQPYFLSCEHTHATAKEALACSYFSDKKFSRARNPELAVA